MKRGDVWRVHLLARLRLPPELALTHPRGKVV